MLLSCNKDYRKNFLKKSSFVVVTILFINMKFSLPAFRYVI